MGQIGVNCRRLGRPTPSPPHKVHHATQVQPRLRRPRGRAGWWTRGRGPGWWRRWSTRDAAARVVVWWILWHHSHHVVGSVWGRGHHWLAWSSWRIHHPWHGWVHHSACWIHHTTHLVHCSPRWPYHAACWTHHPAHWTHHATRWVVHHSRAWLHCGGGSGVPVAQHCLLSWISRRIPWWSSKVLCHGVNSNGWSSKSVIFKHP
jgi:hypothetical protein